VDARICLAVKMLASAGITVELVGCGVLKKKPKNFKKQGMKEHCKVGGTF
jgi:hypothetical protein